jgi:hypothetical protein
LLFVVSGGYWYLRNFLVSGNPVHPLAGEWFGYWLWDRGDMEAQAADIARMNDSIPSVYIPALAAWVLLKGSSTTLKGLLFVAYAALAAWFLTSQYERYLTPTFPFLAVLSSLVIVRLTRLELIRKVWVRLLAVRHRWFLAVLRI